MKIKLKKPFNKGEVTVTEFDIDFVKLTGYQIIEAEVEARGMGETSPNPLFSSRGLAIIAAKASGHIPEDIIGLSAPDFLMVTNTVSNFLYGWVLPGLIQEPSEG
ncbi:phage tail assembly protein [Paenibacillus psychroresistens]|uniref:Phage tail assembly protein n=1 Tax=Paenibacillus psychroresistens TaxID=1778678 RepID=A0A6B8RIH5_9BACL|nr:phage tail assembly protein [Paenibacillus psychroresistens]QGQ95869.1 phage tail assembly protein [Paenibacillus psychroresistens]